MENNIYRWAARSSVGRAGGIILLWDPEKLNVIRWWHMEGTVVINGFWGSKRTQCCIVNVYASCPLDERIELWGRLKDAVQKITDSCI